MLPLHQCPKANRRNRTFFPALRVRCGTCSALLAQRVAVRGKKPPLVFSTTRLFTLSIVNGPSTGSPEIIPVYGYHSLSPRGESNPDCILTMDACYHYHYKGECNFLAQVASGDPSATPLPEADRSIENLSKGTY